MQVKGRPLQTRRELGTRAPTASQRRRGGRRTALAGLPAAVGAGGHPRRLRAPAEHVRPGRADSGPQTPSPPRPGWTRLPGPPGQRRVKEARSLPAAPSPLESPRNDVSTRQLKKSLIIETGSGSWNKLGGSAGPVNNSGASGPGRRPAEPAPRERGRGAAAGSWKSGGNSRNRRSLWGGVGVGVGGEK